MQEWQTLNDVLENMLRETVARGDTLAPGWRDEVRAVVRDMLAAERERMRAACLRACESVIAAAEPGRGHAKGAELCIRAIQAMEMKR